MNKKLLMFFPLVAVMVFTVLALSNSYSLREVPNEVLDISINSNGYSGSGSIIDDTGNVRISYSFKQYRGSWMARTQIERTRSSWFPVTVNHNSGILTVPELGITANVVNLR